MRLAPLLAVLTLALLSVAGLSAVEAQPAAEVVAAPVGGLTGNATVDLVLAIVGLINATATGLAAILPKSSTVALIARLADIANRIGLTLKPTAIKPKTED